MNCHTSNIDEIPQNSRLSVRQIDFYFPNCTSLDLMKILNIIIGIGIRLIGFEFNISRCQGPLKDEFQDFNISQKGIELLDISRFQPCQR